MSQFIPLENVQIASPCHARWDAMEGEGNYRFCMTCAKNVYNLSEMTRFDAEELIASKNGDLCVRYYQRADGTILTQDCPVGVKKLRHEALKPMVRLAAGVGALVAYTLWVFLQSVGSSSYSGRSWRDVQPFKAVMDLVAPTPQRAVMGIVSQLPASEMGVTSQALEAGHTSEQMTSSKSEPLV